MSRISLPGPTIRRRIVNGLICGLFCLAAIGCVQKPAKPTGSYVNHIVLLWFKEDVGKNKIDEIIELTRQLNNIRSIDQLQVGRAIASERNIVDDSFDVGISMRFRSLQDMKGYLKHPLHVELVREHIKPNIAKIIVYDF